MDNLKKLYEECCSEDGSELIKCPYCKGTNITLNSTYSEYGYIAEGNYYCEDCKKVVAEYAYGSIDIKAEEK